MLGWKTKTAAWISIIYGIFGIFTDLHDASTGMNFVVNGLGLLGIGHKIDRYGRGD